MSTELFFFFVFFLFFGKSSITYVSLFDKNNRERLFFAFCASLTKRESQIIPFFYFFNGKLHVSATSNYYLFILLLLLYKKICLIIYKI